MRKFSLALLAFAPLTSYAYDCCCKNNEVDIGADYLYMYRHKVRTDKLIVNEATTPDTTLIDSKDLVKEFEWKSGVRGYITYTPDICSTIEASYTYIAPWTGKESVSAANSIGLAFIDDTNTVDYIQIDRATAKYTSALQWAELNYWRHVTPERCNYFSFAWLVGGRWFYLKEHFTVTVESNPDTSDFRAKTYNRLYGVQLGADVDWNPTRKWTISIEARGAGFLNVARNHLVLKDENNTIELFDLQKERWTDTYLIEGIGSITYHWSQWCDLQVGFQAFYMTGVALAPNQVDSAKFDKRYVHVHGDIAVGGAFAGLTFRF